MSDHTKNIVGELKRYDYAIQNLLPSLWLKGFNFAERDQEPEPRDLVMLQCAPQTEWHLSFYVERCTDRDGHVLESLKTGRLCNWSNVDLVIMSREWVSTHRKVRWTDEQFAFEKTFMAESRKANFYMHLPYIERFNGDHAHIGFRVRYGIDSTLTIADPFNIDGSRGDLRCHLWKWFKIHKQKLAMQRSAA